MSTKIIQPDSEDSIADLVAEWSQPPYEPHFPLGVMANTLLLERARKWDLLPETTREVMAEVANVLMKQFAAAVHGARLKGLLTPKEVAGLLRLDDARTVRALPLRPVRIGRQLRYDRRDIERFIEESKITEPQIQGGNSE
jgi:hypothetical protein